MHKVMHTQLNSHPKLRLTQKDGLAQRDKNDNSRPNLNLNLSHDPRSSRGVRIYIMRSKVCYIYFYQLFWAHIGRGASRCLEYAIS